MSDYQYYNQNQSQNNNNRNSNNNNNNNNNNFDWVSWAIIAVLFISHAWYIALPMLFVKLFAPDNKKKSAPPPLYKPSPAPSKAQARQTAQARTAAQANPTAQAKPDSKAKGVVRDMARSPKSSSGSAILLMVFGALLAAGGAFLLIDPVDMALWSGSLAGHLKDILQWLAVSAGGVAMFFGGLNIKRSMKRYAKYMAVIGSLEAVSIDTLSRKLGYSNRRVTKDVQKMIDKGYFGPAAYLNVELGYLFLTSKADAEISALRNAAEKKTEQAQTRQSADEYSAILQNIRSANDRIADEVLSEKIDRLEAVTAQIFKAVESDPKKRHKIDTFMSYYLPTTQKLLDSYAKFEASGVEGENMRQSKQSIQSAMDSIIHGFECQLDELYKNDAMDIEADIRVMQKMLDRETSTAASDFKLNTEPKVESIPKDTDLGGMAGQEK